MCLVKKLSGVKKSGVKGACCKMCLVKKLSGVKMSGVKRCKRCLV